MDQAPLKNADVLIMSCLTQTPLSLPDPMIGEFCVKAGKFVFLNLVLGLTKTMK